MRKKGYEMKEGVLREIGAVCLIYLGAPSAPDVSGSSQLSALRTCIPTSLVVIGQPQWPSGMMQCGAHGKCRAMITGEGYAYLIR